MSDNANRPVASVKQVVIKTSVVRHYRLFGLNISSEWEIPGLRPGNSKSPADVRIKRGGVDLPVFEPTPGYHHLENGSAILYIPKVARYEIRSGNQIVIDSECGTSERNVNLYLLGSACGALLHQRGALPLHANAVEIQGSAIAFIGPSGAGKSTLAAWFHDRGYRVHADDICAVDFISNAPVVHSGIPRLRLWREALERSGRTASDHQRSFDDYEKYDISTALRTSGDAIPLAAIYELSVSNSGPVEVAALHGMRSIDLLVSNTYRGGFLTRPEEKRRHLDRCVQLAKSVPILRASRTWDLDRFDESARILEAHALAIIADIRVRSNGNADRRT